MDIKTFSEFYNFSDKVVAITGGAGVLCASMAELLADAGATVAILDINQDLARKQAEKMSNAGGEATRYPVMYLKKPVWKQPLKR